MRVKAIALFAAMSCIFTLSCGRPYKLSAMQQKVCVSSESDEEAEKRYWNEAYPDLPDGVSCLARPFSNKQVRVSSRFRDSSHSFRPGRHTGTDVPLKQGTRTLAMAPGKVIYARSSEYGTNKIVIDMGGGWTYTVLHLSAIRVSVGETVTVGYLLGLSGGKPGVPGSGPCTTGPHLHFSLAYKGKCLDVERYLCSKL